MIKELKIEIIPSESMAVSSCESSAPTDFNLSNISSSFESSSGISVAVERCPLCSGTKRPYSCKVCVNGGLFLHSKAKYPDTTNSDSDRYIDTFRKWERVKLEKKKLQDRVAIGLSKNIGIGLKREQIDKCKRKIQLLKLAIIATKESCKNDKSDLQNLQESNAIRKPKGRRHLEKLEKITKFVTQMKSDIESRDLQCAPVLDKLARERKLRIHFLTEYIFPVEEVPRGDQRSEPLSTTSALKDACHTDYVKGQWVYTDNGSDVCHQIVAPKLPSNGDYSAYNICVISSRRENGSMPEVEPKHTNSGYEISAALCFTAQFTSIAAHILSINLPRKICYSEFCSNEMSEKQFANAVAKLNQNILFLCFSQGVNVDCLVSHHTLSNILLLLKCKHLGRFGSFEIDESMMKSIEDPYPSSEESDDEINASEDEPDLATEWESVPHELSEMDLPTVLPHMGIEHGTYIPPQNPAGGGLMLSAAASITSFWRAATWQYDKK